MKNRLDGKKIAILMTNGVEDSEFRVPYQMLNEEGASVDIISPQKDKVRTWKIGNWYSEITPDKLLRETNAADYDALVLPGGVMNPDALRMDPDAKKFAAHFMQKGKPLAAICHGPWLLIETNSLWERKLTSWPSLKTDLENAGAIWMDLEVVVDNGLVTSRKPDDLTVFCNKMIEEFAEGIHA